MYLLAGYRLVIDPGLGGDFARQDQPAMRRDGLSRDSSQWILGQYRVDDSVTDLVADFVGVTSTD
jgi:hypothetical protein